ncbi:MAG: restriction endonuclease [Bacteroidetes bacterium]|nr:restriction endonuclease [Bacteroidota bacterium]
MTEIEIIDAIVTSLKEKVFEKHITSSLSKHTSISSYNINPIVVKYLSKLLEDKYSPEGVAKALFYPRVLGTSINTSFGTHIQNMLVDLRIAEGSMLKGMDIEFVDKLDDRRKYCQLKSGPNTINSGDVKPLIKEFSDIINLSRTNRALDAIRNSDFIVGVLYGVEDELSVHYKAINRVHPVIIGQEFWHRLTGYENFYSNLVVSLHKSIDELDTKDMINQGCAILADEIRNSDLFEF